MNKEYLKSFIIELIISVIYYIFYGYEMTTLYEKTGLMNYRHYSILAPLGIGLASLLANNRLNYNMKLKDTYLVIVLFQHYLLTIYYNY